jgi:hypothetical protein
MGKAPQVCALDAGCCRQKRHPLPLPSLDPRLQGGVNEPAKVLKHVGQRHRLRLVRARSAFVSESVGMKGHDRKAAVRCRARYSPAIAEKQGDRPRDIAVPSAAPPRIPVSHPQHSSVGRRRFPLPRNVTAPTAARGFRRRRGLGTPCRARERMRASDARPHRNRHPSRPLH